MHGRGRGVHGREGVCMAGEGVCMAGKGCAWQGKGCAWQGGMHVDGWGVRMAGGHACHACPPIDTTGYSQ